MVTAEHQPLGCSLIFKEINERPKGRPLMSFLNSGTVLDHRLRSGNLQSD